MATETGSRVEEALRVRRFEQPPSPEAFSSHVEPANVPAVFSGAVEDWAALSKWNPSTGGLDYLEERVGPAIVEVMLSKSAPVFYGDLRSHERVPLPFSTFIASCKSLLNMQNVSGPFTQGSELASTQSEEACSTSFDNPDQLYLAQVPILNVDNKERCTLETLRDDIQMPIFLKTKAMSSINLWMNRARSRSSTHYDPHHNLLCVVAGCKQVVLWPPSASPFLYPMPVFGEASNHSAIDIEHPNLSVHSRAKAYMKYSQKVVLHSGDALFIPEGWFHQVDSDDFTIAVNFWWKSSVMSDMLEHMDAYYLRRILNRLVEKEKDQMLQKGPIERLERRRNIESTSQISEGYHEFDSEGHCVKIRKHYEKHGMINQLDSFTVHVLHELVSLVHETVNVSGQHSVSVSGSIENSDINWKGECKKDNNENFSLVENDPVASIFWSVEPLVLQRVLLAMVHHFPRTLEALILHILSPIAAEVLTWKFDEMDQQTTKEQQCDFYRLFYSIFDDQHAAMDAILKGKELFSLQAFRNVLDHYLGVNLGPG